MLFLTREQLASIFNEWAMQYAENPDKFTNVLDEQGNPVMDYVDSCAIHVEELAKELGIDVDSWNAMYDVISDVVQKCKDTTGMHSKIDFMVSRNQITHDAMGTDIK